MSATRIPRPILACLILGAALVPLSRAQAQTSPADLTMPTPRIDLHGFFHLDVTRIRSTGAGADSSGFQAVLGPFDLFMVSRLSERVSFLGELVVEQAAGSSTQIELERAHVRYSFWDGLELKVGRMHSPISLWNTQYHHGALLEPTVSRPGPVRFEDDGGLLPLHAVGIEASGDLGTGRVNWRYSAGLSNGGASDHRVVQTSGDENQDKSFTLALSAGVSQPCELQLGGSFLTDRYEGGSPGDAGADERILGLNVSGRGRMFEFMAEHFTIAHRDRASRERMTNRAWYAVGSTGRGSWHAYVVGERMTLEPADLRFAELPSHEQTVSLGLRHDLSVSNVLKLQYVNSLASGTRTHGLVLQTAFAF